MASKKITELTALPTPGQSDLAAVVDMSGTPTTKKSTIAQIAAVLVIAMSQVTGLVAALAAKVPTSRNVTAGSGLTGGGDLSADRTLAADFGTGAGKVTQGNDSRLSDARTPTAHKTSHQAGGSDELTLTGMVGLLATAQVPIAHAASHKSAGSDPIRIDELKVGTDVTTLNATATEHGLLRKLSGVSTEFLNGNGAFSTPAGGTTHWEPLTNGNAASPDLVYALGDVIMIEVPNG